MLCSLTILDFNPVSGTKRKISVKATRKFQSFAFYLASNGIVFTDPFDQYTVT